MEKISLHYLKEEKTFKEIPKDINNLRLLICKEFSISSEELEDINLIYKNLSNNDIILCSQTDYETFLNQEKNSSIFLQQKVYDQSFLDTLLSKQKDFEEEKDKRQTLYRGQSEEIYSQIRKLNGQKAQMFQACLKDIRQIEAKMKFNKEEILKTKKKLGLKGGEENLNINKNKEEENKNTTESEKKEEVKLKEVSNQQKQPVRSIPCRGGQNHFPYRVMQIRAEKRRQEFEAKERAKLKSLSVSVDSAKNLSVNGEPVFKKVNEVLTETVEKVKEVVLLEKEKESQIKKIKQITKDAVKEINSLTKLVIHQSNELVNKLETIKISESDEKKEKEIKLKSAKLLEEKKEKAKDVTHFMIQCCGCKYHKIIKGIKYKCKVCKNVDFCEKCFQEKKNEKDYLGHEFEQILESEFPQRIKSKNTKYLQRGIVQKNERCNVCGMCPIMGIRYKCAVCDDFNFCENCEEAHGTRHDHPLIKLTYTLIEDKFNKYYMKLNSFNDGK